MTQMKVRAKRSDGKAPAAKTKLLEGEHSIMRAKPSVHGEVKVLHWSVRPVGHARPIEKRTQVPKRVPDQDLRRRALATAKKILDSEGRAGRWTAESELSEYIRAVVKPKIESSSLAENSKARYRIALRLLVGECGASDHQHRKSLKQLTIRSGTKYTPMEECLTELARLHGSESARQARTVLSGYVLKQLKRDELVDGNVIRGEKIDLSTNAKAHEGREGGIALTRDQYNAVVEYLLGLDPADGAEKPKRGRWTLEDAISKRRNAIDLTLLQAGTGLRISEARQAWCGLFSDTAGGLSIHVVKDIAKRGFERTAYVLDERVAERLRIRLAKAQASDELIVGSPFDPSKVWDLRNCTRVVEALYLELGAKLDIKAFERERSHIWRATLNTLLIDTVPEAMRAAQFGHTAEVNKKSYTDAALSPAMVAAARERLGQ
jgi:hypothetical protein